jgi:flagellar biogenesis protein FliO
MTQKIILFLAFPFFIFGTIEIAKEPKAAPPPIKKELTVKKKVPVKAAKLEVKATARAASSDTQKEPASEEVEEDFPKSSAETPAYLDGSHQKQFFISLIFICVLIFFALVVIYIYKRAAPMSKITRKNSRNNIKVLERRSISPQTYLYHIQVGDKQFIISESKVDVRSVATLDWPERK